MGATILIVDGAKQFVGRLRTLFSGHGYYVLSAATADEGRAALAEFRNRIQIVVVGTGLPDGPASEIMANIARWKPGAKPRTIAASGEGAPETALHADRVLPQAASDQEWLNAVAVLLDGAVQPR